MVLENADAKLQSTTDGTRQNWSDGSLTTARCCLHRSVEES